MVRVTAVVLVVAEGVGVRVATVALVVDRTAAVALAVAVDLPGHVFVTLGTAPAVGVLTGAVEAAVGVSAVGVAAVCVHPVGRGSVGSLVGVQLDVAVAVGRRRWLRNGHHVGHQPGFGDAV